MSTQTAGSPFGDLAILSTVVDAAFAFLRGDRWAAALLLGAAALSTRVRGVGILASLLVRLVRRLR